MVKNKTASKVCLLSPGVWIAHQRRIQSANARKKSILPSPAFIPEAIRRGLRVERALSTLKREDA